MSGYAVVDLQTTGLEPSMQHRVVEIAMTLTSDTGIVEESWCTLVNPQRDVGETALHGISARDVLPAPTFDDLVPLVLQSVEGRTLVAHNLGFELGFLEAELRRCGVPLTVPLSVGVPTMEWFGLLSSRKRRRLIDCCDEVGITLTQRYSSRHQAAAVAELLQRYLAATSGAPPWGESVAWTRAYPWPRLTTGAEPCHLVARGERQHPSGTSWLDRIIGKMPSGGAPSVDAYLELLEMALLDRYLSAHEIESLLAVASRLGLDRHAVESLHEEYVVAMARVALKDGVLTPDERTDLEHVATSLGLDISRVEEALVKAADLAEGPQHKSEFRLQAGDVICFTGSMTVPREALERAATDFGFVVGGLSKRTKLLVAADPDSLSGKAKKARDYGVAIVSEAGFRSLAQQAGRG